MVTSLLGRIQHIFWQCEPTAKLRIFGSTNYPIIGYAESAWNEKFAAHFYT